MTKLKKLLVNALLIILTLSATANLVKATSMTFTVPGRGTENKTINLMIDDHVLIEFTVVGSINFSMTYPNGTTQPFGEKGTFNHPFICTLEGEYTLTFSNKDSLEDKLVVLEYEIEHYILGMPQMLFLAIIIVLVCVAAVAAFIFMGKPR
jgi:hypothetical protein